MSSANEIFDEVANDIKINGINYNNIQKLRQFLKHKDVKKITRKVYNDMYYKQLKTVRGEKKIQPIE